LRNLFESGYVEHRGRYRTIILRRVFGKQVVKIGDGRYWLGIVYSGVFSYRGVIT
jgi:hypothetical protein